MHFLFIFLDGVGLGYDDVVGNPLAKVHMPVLEKLLGGRRLIANDGPIETDRATLIALDACMGVPGVPQSATGQASLLTGKNVPALVDGHYGPKPNKAIAAILAKDNLFKMLKAKGLESSLLHAYPEGYFKSIESGRRIYSAIPLAGVEAGITLKTHKDLYAGTAVSGDFTNDGWRSHLGYEDMPQVSPKEAGERMAHLAQEVSLAFFEYWLSDYMGHKQEVDAAVKALQVFDQVLDGVMTQWNDEDGLIFLTSDHGNLEDMDTRRHTTNPVPGLVIGDAAMRRKFVRGLHSLADVTPAIVDLF